MLYPNREPTAVNNREPLQLESRTQALVDRLFNFSRPSWRITHTHFWLLDSTVQATGTAIPCGCTTLSMGQVPTPLDRCPRCARGYGCLGWLGTVSALDLTGHMCAEQAGEALGPKLCNHRLIPCTAPVPQAFLLMQAQPTGSRVRESGRAR